MRILVTGASGLIGSHTARCLLARGDSVVAACGAHEERIPEDVRSDAERLLRLRLDEPNTLDTQLEPVDAAPIDAVIHCAAIPDIGACEEDPERARIVNVGATARLARWTATRGGRFVVLSTDQIFDGARSFYVEADAASPLHVYGRTKLEAESSALGAGGVAVAARLALTYGASPSGVRSASEQIATKLRAGERVRLFTDEFRTPILAEDAAAALTMLAAIERPPPIVNIAGPDRISRHEFGLRVAQTLGLDSSLIDAARAADLDFDPPRAPDLSLDTTLLRSLMDDPPRGIAEGLRTLL